MTPATISDKYVAAPDAARALGVPYRTFVRWLGAADSPIRAKQDASGEWRIPRAQLERLVHERTVQGADAVAWQAAAQLVREDVVRQRDANNARIAVIARRLASLPQAGAEWEAATDDMREALAEDAALFNCGLAIAERVQKRAYELARDRMADVARRVVAQHSGAS